MVGTTRCYEIYHFVKRDIYDKFLKYPIPIREALLFKELCAGRMPIEIKPEDLFCGWYGYEETPEEYKGVADPKTLTEKYIDYKYITPEEMAFQAKTFAEYGMMSTYIPGHTCLKYENILKYGLNDYKRRVLCELTTAEKGSDKEVYLNAMLISLEAVQLYANRFATMAKMLADNETDPAQKAKYMRMYETNMKVPMEPAEDFYEAMQSLWTVHALTPIADNDWYSISYGRLDQFMYPYYQASLDKGATREELLDLVKQLYLFSDNYCDPSMALNFGGIDDEGNDLLNDLSMLFLDGELETYHRNPDSAVRVNKNTPDEKLLKFIDERLFIRGKPSFYGEEACLKAVMHRDIPEEVAKTYSISSCNGFSIAGEQRGDSWGAFNMHLPLELALNGGKPLHGDLGFELKTVPLDEVNDVETLYAKFEEYFGEVFDEMTRYRVKTQYHHMHNYPNAFLSVLTSGCIEKGCDRMFGPPYQTAMVETFGLANVADAITAIDKLVFKEKKYTLKEYIEATRADFVGYEQMRKEIVDCDKYGTGKEVPDGHMLRLVRLSDRVCKARNSGETRYMPSLHTLNMDVDFGHMLYATMDGRLRGTAYAKNAGPSNLSRKADPTDLVLSASAIEQFRLSGGQAIDLYFDKKLLRDEEGKRKILALFRTYFERGGLQIQVNSVDSETLKKAYADPDSYKNVIVKIGGYSMRFNDMTDAKKLEYIERTEYDEGLR